MRFFGQKQSTIIISEINQADLQSVSDIHSQSFTNGWGDGTLANMLKSAGMKGLVARLSSQKDNLLSGFIIYRVVSDEAEVITIATHSKHRKKGCARAMMDEMIRRALSERLHEIFLEVDETNLSAINLYQSLGFKNVGKREAYYKSGEQSDKKAEPIQDTQSTNAALVMRLDLAA